VIFPLQAYQKPMCEMLGTPPGTKHHVAFDTGYGALGTHRNQIVEEMLTGRDEYLEPVR